MWAFVQRNAWVLPLVFALVLGTVGFASYRTLEASAKRQLAAQLTAAREFAIASLEIWSRNKAEQTDVHARDPRIVAIASELLETARRAEDPRAALRAAPAQASFRELMQPIADAYGFLGYGIASPTGQMIAARRDTNVGSRWAGVDQILDRVLAGETVVTRPLLEEQLGPDPEDANMLVVAPLRDDDGAVFAVFGFALRPVDEFTRILAAAQLGESGETYAFDDRGRMASPSRFERDLPALGLLEEHASSVLAIQIRDPGGNLSEGFVPALPLEARPLTVAAAEAIARRSGVNVEGYPDYRGAPVVGAWGFIPSLGLGITSEIDVDEATAPLVELRRTFGLVMGLLAFATLGMFLYSFLAVRLRQQVDEVRQLGRYRIESRIGKGGMGTVYLARHSLLRRPTAIKVLNADRAGSEGIARFEREVQTTSSLRHPNTVEIFDYGYTPDGTFYYAMEYLHGITLAECVEHDGPQPEARVLHMMRQACGSLAEAHGTGLIHRDIKPANVMLCDSGGMLDVVKVLDFGLVRCQEQAQDAALTDVASLTGTPLFMAPEAVRDPEKIDARSDVYQLGHLAYFLLTGQHLFTADSPMDVMLKHVGEAPMPPSEVLGRPMSPDLERVILECLEKRPEDRPADACAMLDALEACKIEGQWRRSDAKQWWAAWGAEVGFPSTDPDSSVGSAPTGIEMARRARSSF